MRSQQPTPSRRSSGSSPAGVRRQFPDRNDLYWLGLAAVALLVGAIVTGLRVWQLDRNAGMPNPGTPNGSTQSGGRAPAAPAAPPDRPTSGTR